MMLCRNSLKQVVSITLLMSAISFGGTAYSQDSSKTVNTTETKIRNIDGVAAVV